MSKIRINDLARELEVKSKAILDVLSEVGVTEKKTHSSSLEDHEAEKVRVHFRASGEASGAAKSARASRVDPDGIKTKIDLSHISKPGDVLKAIIGKQQAAAPAPPVTPPRPAPPAPEVKAPAAPQSGSPTVDCGRRGRLWTAYPIKQLICYVPRLTPGQGRHARRQPIQRLTRVLLPVARQQMIEVHIENYPAIAAQRRREQGAGAGNLWVAIRIDVYFAMQAHAAA